MYTPPSRGGKSGGGRARFLPALALLVGPLLISSLHEVPALIVEVGKADTLSGGYNRVVVNIKASEDQTLDAAIRVRQARSFALVGAGGLDASRRNGAGFITVFTDFFHLPQRNLIVINNQIKIILKSVK